VAQLQEKSWLILNFESEVVVGKGDTIFGDGVMGAENVFLGEGGIAKTCASPLDSRNYCYCVSWYFACPNHSGHSFLTETKFLKFFEKFKKSLDSRRSNTIEYEH
jgi:hypothetical protein